MRFRSIPNHQHFKIKVQKHIRLEPTSHRRQVINFAIFHLQEYLVQVLFPIVNVFIPAAKQFYFTNLPQKSTQYLLCTKKNFLDDLVLKVDCTVKTEEKQIL